MKHACAVLGTPRASISSQIRPADRCPAPRWPAAPSHPGLNTSPHHRPSDAPLIARAIGFDLSGSDSPAVSAERQSEELTRAAASLLLYQAVLKGKPAQSFLQVLAHCHKGSPVQLLEHYGELYKALATDGYATWQDYLLNQVLRGADNPFAWSAAKLEAVDHLLPAVRNDLGVLQSLAVPESTLAGWVEGVAGPSESWAAAATAARGLTSHGAADGAVPTIPEAPPDKVQAPLTDAHRAALRSRIAGEAQWSEAAPLLQRYHAAHDYGVVSLHSVLRWTGTSLQAHNVLRHLRLGEDAAHSPTADVIDAAAGILAAASDIMSGPAAPDVLLPPRAYEAVARRLLALHAPADWEGPAPGSRLVMLPSDKLSTLPDLAWALSHHPRVAFVVLCPLMAGSDARRAEVCALRDGRSWPRNAVVVVRAPEGREG